MRMNAGEQSFLDEHVGCPSKNRVQYHAIVMNAELSATSDMIRSKRCECFVTFGKLQRFGQTAAAMRKDNDTHRGGFSRHVSTPINLLPPTADFQTSISVPFDHQWLDAVTQEEKRFCCTIF